MTENYLNILAETIRTNWDAPALTDFYLTEDGTAQDTSRGNHYTYGEMYAEVCRVAELLTSLGLQKGDHIAICGANSAHWVIAYLAIAKMQGVSVTVMHTLQPDEMARLVAFSDAKALFTDEDIWTELAPLYRPSLGDLSAVISLADWSILRGEKITNYKLQITNGEIGFSPVEPDSLAMICFTSGTSGRAKGVMLSYKNLSNNTIDAIQAFPESEINNFICFLPLPHMYGFMIEYLGQIVRGRHVFFHKGFLSTDEIWKAICFVQPCGMAIIPFIISNLYVKYRSEIIEKLGAFCSQIHVGGGRF